MKNLKSRYKPKIYFWQRSKHTVACRPRLARKPQHFVLSVKLITNNSISFRWRFHIIYSVEWWQLLLKLQFSFDSNPIRITRKAARCKKIWINYLIRCRIDFSSRQTVLIWLLNLNNAQFFTRKNALYKNAFKRAKITHRINLQSA